RCETAKLLIAIPTYNERANIEKLCQAILLGDAVNTIPPYAPDADILIVDDGSPDGTGELALQLVKEEEKSRGAGMSRIHVMQRGKKLGLGTAQKASYEYAR